jgi:uncharacterized DUF497 family protein
MGSRIAALRRKLAFGHYELTAHAKEEMEADGFSVLDVKSAVYSGRIVATQQRVRGRRKFVVAGRADDGRSLSVVCRLTQSGRVRVITVFAT